MRGSEGKALLPEQFDAVAAREGACCVVVAHAGVAAAGAGGIELGGVGVVELACEHLLFVGGHGHGGGRGSGSGICRST